MTALSPDVILAHGAATLAPLLQAARTVPIVFVIVADPVGGGFVDSLARPGGHTTGFMPFEYSLSGKWLELLKQIAPDVTRVAVLRDASNPTGIGQFGVIQAIAPSLRVELSPVNMRDAGEIERAVAAFARTSNGGLVLTASGLAQLHRDLVITLAARHKLPAVLQHLDQVHSGLQAEIGFQQQALHGLDVGGLEAAHDGPDVGQRDPLDAGPEADFFSFCDAISHFARRS